jgi:hypothetical protein
MSGTNQTAGPLEWRQRHADDVETIESHLDGRQAQIHTAMPGSIVSYDATTMTATVQPALQVFQTQVDGTIQQVNIAPIADVPVHFPGGGGHLMTFPVQAGDECLIVFSERSIDNWFQHGGQQQPSDWRMHDINDAVVHVGTRSQPNVPGNVDGNAVQLRSDDGNTVLSLDGKAKTVTLNTDKVTLTAQSSITLTVGGNSVVIDGSAVTIQGRQFLQHEHKGVQTGSANTEGVV